MDDLEKKAQLEAEQKAEAEAKAKAEAQDAEFEASIADLSDEEKEAKRAEKKALHSKNQIDYKKLLEEEKEKREKAEKALAGDRYHSKQNKEEEEELDDDDKPITKAELLRINEEERQKTDKMLNQERIESIASSLSVNEDEKALALEIHKNRTFPSGMTLKEQMEEAFVIANKGRLIGERNEALKALKNKPSNNASSARQDIEDGNEPSIEGNIKVSLSRKGFVYNSTLKRYEKKLPNEKMMVFDVKTKKTSIL